MKTQKKDPKVNDLPTIHDTRSLFKKAIAVQLSKIVSRYTEAELMRLIETPKSTTHGHYALPLPKLLAQCNKYSTEEFNPHPATWCKEIAQQFEPTPMIERATPVGVFLNFKVEPFEYIQHTLLQVYKEKERYGWKKLDNDTVLIDYSSPNIAKPFHAGHLRSTILGNFLRKIHIAMGYKVISINYLGDWGKQYGLLAVGYEKYGDPEALKKDAIKHLYDVYVRINEESSTIPDIDKQASKYFWRMEQGDEQVLERWKLFRELSIEMYLPIYKRLGISFDDYSGESKTEPYIKKIYDLLEEKKLVTKLQDTAWVIDLSHYNLGQPIVRRADGTSFYLTRDLASVMLRMEAYPCSKSIYVVGTEQERYLKQVFTICKLIWGDSLPSLHHAGFGHIHGMSTRKGTAVFLQDILDTAQNKMLSIMSEPENKQKYEDIMQRGVQVSETESYKGEKAVKYIADRLGTSAVIAQDMSGRRIKNYTFSWDRMIDARGDTGVFLQYTHARVCGIERKNSVRLTTDCNFGLLKEKEAFELAQMISHFPEVVQNSFDALEPSTLISYLFKLAHLTSQSNYTMRVKGMDTPLAEARLLLFWAAKTTLRNGLRLVGIEPLERM
ncbi:arginyl-tRNA synthetase [Spinellus fusiger]|nr:arginyl-tRNA synthetase [Spinellus fusiger]